MQITTAETLGVETRGNYYEEVGALRDMIQNHGLQLLSLVAMEPPTSFEADAVRDEKGKVLRSIRLFPPTEVDSHVARGQYGPGSIEAREVPGYRQESDVSPTSTVETYVAARFYVDNWRWQDVPFYVRTGKRLSRKKTEIAIQFKPVPHGFLGHGSSERPAPNVLVMRIQPDEGIAVRVGTKSPGQTMAPRPVDLDFRYLSSLGVVPPDEYETLLLDCMLGDQVLFARRDGVEAQWAVVAPIVQGWGLSPAPDFPNYRAGTWGPAASDALLEREGHRWRRL